MKHNFSLYHNLEQNNKFVRGKLYYRQKQIALTSVNPTNSKLELKYPEDFDKICEHIYMMYLGMVIINNWPLYHFILGDNSVYLPVVTFAYPGGLDNNNIITDHCYYLKELVRVK